MHVGGYGGVVHILVHTSRYDGKFQPNLFVSLLLLFLIHHLRTTMSHYLELQLLTEQNSQGHLESLLVKSVYIFLFLATGNKSSLNLKHSIN